MKRLGVKQFPDEPSNPVNQRKIKILTLLRQRGPMTRAEISRSSGIAKSSISLIVDELIAEGHVHQVRTSSSNRSKNIKGRPGDLIEIDPSAGAAIGIEISFGRIIGAIGDASHEVLASRTIEIELRPSPSQILRACQSLVSELMSATRVTPSRILGVGIGISSSIYTDHNQKTIYSQEIWNNFDIANDLEEATGFKVQVENSANLAGYAETIWGSGKILNNYIYFKFDQQIDGALIVNQEVVVGTYGAYADFGHLILDPNGPICECGQRGCLDSYSGFQSLIKQASLALGYEVTPKTFMSLVASDNFICRQIIQDGAQRLGQGIAYLSRVINPEAVIFGNSFIEMPADFIKVMIESFESFSSKQNSHIRIYSGQLAELASALGAVAQILNYPLVAV